ncbi:hypothetical protein KEM54_004382 [Ascosphaera aggregata]|nr:hypothetical protein KEM54_004382 [Ascosphaera aggregata]
MTDLEVKRRKEEETKYLALPMAEYIFTLRVRYKDYLLTIVKFTVTVEEPRRSGRSTKGQHTKNDLLEPTTTAKKQGRRSSSANTSKKRISQEPTPTSDPPSTSTTPEPGVNAADDMGSASEYEPNADGIDNGEDEEEIIRCICGEYEEEEDIERDMICCDKCSAWQHNDCMGLNFPKGQEPEQYFCEKCRPENHEELLAKVAKGERPWEEAARLRAARIAELKKKKKGKKGGRKSNAKGGGQKTAVTESSPDTESGTVKREGSATAASMNNATPTASSKTTKAVSHSPVTPIATAQLDGQGHDVEPASHRKRKSEHINAGANQPSVKQQRLSQDHGSPSQAIQEQSITTSAALPAAVPAPVTSAPLQQEVPPLSLQAGAPLAAPTQFILATAPIQPQQQYQQKPQVVLPILGQGQQMQTQPLTNHQPQQPTEQPITAQEAVPPPRPPSQQELLDSLTPARRNVANALAKLFADVIPESIRNGAFLLPPTLTIPQAGVTFALAVEFSMYKNLCQGIGEIKEPYKQQMRTILFNVKRNPALRDGILSGAITADRLSKMSTKDMASKEQRMREDEIKKEAERQHIIVQEEGPRIRRTHKGEEVIEDDTQPVVNESIFSNAPRRGTITSVQSGDSGKEKGHVSPRRKSPSLEPAGGNHQHSPHDSHHNNERATEGVHGKGRSHSPGVDHEARFGAPSGQHFPFPFPHDQPPVSRAEADAEIDALLGDDENNEEPYSPPYSPKAFIDDPDDLTHNRAKTIVWTGTLSMASFTQFHCEARHVGGADLSERVSWQDLMPPTLVIDGRIDVKLATNYLCGLRFSQTTDVCVTAISAPTQLRERTEFDRIFEYFAQRNRYGVIGKHTNALVKDTYVVPVEKQNGSLSGGDSAAARRPEFLDLLENNSVEDPVQERLLLVVFVVRNGEISVTNTLSLGGQTSTRTASAGPSAHTPSQQTGSTGGNLRQASDSRTESTSTTMSSQTQSQARTPQQQISSGMLQLSTATATITDPGVSALTTPVATTAPTVRSQRQQITDQLQIKFTIWPRFLSPVLA